MALIGAINVIVGTITELTWLTSSTFKAKWSAEVPLTELNLFRFKTFRPFPNLLMKLYLHMMMKYILHFHFFFSKKGSDKPIFLNMIIFEKYEADLSFFSQSRYFIKP